MSELGRRDTAAVRITPDGLEIDGVQTSGFAGFHVRPGPDGLTEVQVNLLSHDLDIEIGASANKVALRIDGNYDIVISGGTSTTIVSVSTDEFRTGLCAAGIAAETLRGLCVAVNEGHSVIKFELGIDEVTEFFKPLENATFDMRQLSE